MIGNVKMQTVKRITGRSLTGDRPLFLALYITRTTKYVERQTYKKNFI